MRKKTTFATNPEATGVSCLDFHCRNGHQESEVDKKSTDTHSDVHRVPHALIALTGQISREQSRGSGNWVVQRKVAQFVVVVAYPGRHLRVLRGMKEKHLNQLK